MYQNFLSALEIQTKLLAYTFLAKNFGVVVERSQRLQRMLVVGEVDEAVAT